jgi:Transposase DDE domain
VEDVFTTKTISTTGGRPMAVYSMIVAFCNEMVAEWHKYQRTNLAWSMYAIFVRRSLVLSHLAQHFPMPQQARVRYPQHVLWHKLKRLRRFLSNPRLEMEGLYQRLTYLALAVSDAPGRLVPVLVDLTYMHPYAFLVASVNKGGRALPIAWHAFRRDLVGEEVYSENQLIDRLMAAVVTRIPPTLTAVIVADREFARASFFRHLQRLGCDFVVRVDRETWVHHASYVGAMGKLALAPGMHMRWLPHSAYGQEERVPINLLVVWKRGYAEPWLLATSLSDPKLVFSLYRSRMKIEHGFRDWKTHLRLKHTLCAQNVAYVKGLLTVLALLYWFIALCGLHWNQPRFRCRIACWGRPSFFKTALDLLTTADDLALATWPRILAWIKDKLWHLRPLPKLYLLRYRRHRPWLQFSG